MRGAPMSAPRFSATKFELFLNKNGKALGLTLPLRLLAVADEAMQ
jgi:hypothetical protein